MMSIVYDEYSGMMSIVSILRRGGCVVVVVVRESVER
jgi:hypothetical protein